MAFQQYNGKAHQSAGEPNCLSFNSTGKLEPGIRLKIGQISHLNQGVLPPHLRVGDQFVAIDKLHGPRVNAGIMRHASLRYIQLPQSGKSFEVFCQPRSDDPRQMLVYAHCGMPAGTKLNPYIVDLRIWSGACGTAVVKTWGQEALARFVRAGDYLTTFYPNGLVRQIYYLKGSLVVKVLSHVDMARLRCEAAELHLKECDDSERGIRRRDGIIFGLINLLKMTKSSPEAQEVILEFLGKQKLGQHKRGLMVGALRELGSVRALEFTDHGFGGRSNPDRSRPPADVLLKKKKRSEFDRELRYAMRGPSGGGSGKSHSHKEN